MIFPKTSYYVMLFLLVGQSAFIYSSQANISAIQEQECKLLQDQRSIAAESVSRKQALFKLMYELIKSFPREIINLIISYDYEFKGKCIAVIPVPGKISALCALPGNKIASAHIQDERHRETYNIIVWQEVAEGQKTVWKEVDTFAVDSLVKIVAPLPEDRLLIVEMRTISVRDLAKKSSQKISDETIIRSVAVLPNNVLAVVTNPLNVAVYGVNHHVTMKRCLPTIIIRDSTKFNTEPVRILTGHTDIIYSLLALPSGLLISASNDATLKVWDLSREQEDECIGTLSDSENTFCPVTLARASVCDDSFVSTDKNGIARLWRPVTVGGQRTWECWKKVSLDDTGAERCYAVLPHHALVCSSVSGNSTIVDPIENKKILLLRGTPSPWIEDCQPPFLVLPKGHLVLGVGDHKIQIWR